MPSIEDISLITANFGNAESFANVLEDWFQFIGGKPGEVIVVDCTDDHTQDVLHSLYRAGKIDKLQLVRPGLPENGKNFCYYREHLAAASAIKPYLLFFKSDSLPYATSNKWISEAFNELDRPEIFAMSGSFNIDSRCRDDRPGWYLTKKCSENFALMKRSMFVKSMEWFAGGYISSGFCGDNPAAATGQSRFFMEVAFERYMEENGLLCLARKEDLNWTVFHTNVSDPRLATVREQYRQRRGVINCMNSRHFRAKVGGCYYGQFLNGRLHEWRSQFGRRALSSQIRRFLRVLGDRLRFGN